LNPRHLNPRQWSRITRTLLGLLFRRPLVGASIIPITSDDQIVLVKRKDNGLWSLPGGLVDWGEDINQAIAREIQEETGLHVSEIGRLVGVYSSAQRDPRFHSVCIAVEARVSGAFAIEDVLEIEAVRAFSKAEIPMDDLAHDHAHHLRDYFSGATTLA
jgi:8-oxo-dGTP diphosphatase